MLNAEIESSTIPAPIETTAARETVSKRIDLDFIDLLKGQSREVPKTDDQTELTFVTSDRKLERQHGEKKEDDKAQDKALKQLDRTLERLQPQPYEPGLADLSRALGKAILNSDVKEIDRLLQKHKDSDSFEDALKHVSETLDDAGIIVDWDDENEMLSIMRPPSVFLNGPEGVKVDISAKGEGSKHYSVEPRKNRPPGFNVDPYTYREKMSGPATGLKEMNKTAIEKLAKDHDGIKSIIEEVKLHGALEHNGGFGKVNTEPDKITPLVEAFFDKRLKPLAKAVQQTTTDEERQSLAEALNARFESTGMFAEYSEEDGFLITMYSEGTADGYSIEFPLEAGSQIHGFALRGPAFHDPTKNVPAVHRVFEGDPIKEISPNDALRGLHRRALEKQALRRY